ncbi:MAG: hypothetical protein FWC89_10045 [Defluviitaleaceae bacterium]|nr:hypothetical protein [Defluviitaleaceae bacterium]
MAMFVLVEVLALGSMAAMLFNYATLLPFILVMMIVFLVGKAQAARVALFVTAMGLGLGIVTNIIALFFSPVAMLNAYVHFGGLGNFSYDLYLILSAIALGGAVIVVPVCAYLLNFSLFSLAISRIEGGVCWFIKICTVASVAIFVIPLSILLVPVPPEFASIRLAALLIIFPVTAIIVPFVMLIHAIRYAEGNKIKWLPLVIFLPVLGSLIYISIDIFGRDSRVQGYVESVGYNIG